MESTLIKDLKVGLKSLNLTFIVLDVSRPSTTKDGHEIRSVKVSDRTGCIQLSMWGECGTLLQPGDICRMTRGYVSTYKGAPTLYLGKGGEFVKIGEFCFIFNEAVNISEIGANASLLSANSDSSHPTITLD